MVTSSIYYVHLNNIVFIVIQASHNPFEKSTTPLYNYIQCHHLTTHNLLIELHHLTTHNLLIEVYLNLISVFDSLNTIISSI